jgi:hypothetical protein
MPDDPSDEKTPLMSLDTRTIATISAIVGVTLTTLLGVVGFIGKGSYTPIIFDKLFGLSEYVNKEAARQFDKEIDSMSEKVDSGYTESIAIGYDQAGKWKKSRVMLFYAEQHQRVELYITGSTGGSSTLTTKIDESQKNLTPGSSFTLFRADVTKRLCFDCTEGGSGNIHKVQFTPKNLQKGDLIVVDVLVVVFSKQ